MVTKINANELQEVGPRFVNIAELAGRLRESAEAARVKVGMLDMELYGRALPKDLDAAPKPAGGFFTDHATALQDAQDSLDRVTETLDRILSEFGPKPPLQGIPATTHADTRVRVASKW